MQWYGFPFYLRLVRKTLFNSRGTFARLTPKRFVMMSLFIPTLFVGQLIHRIALALDDVLFPGWRDVKVVRPMFMVGIPRSGTTFLHRLVSKDTENFTTLKTWEMILAPSILERRLFMALGRVDRALGGYGRKLVTAVEDRAFADVRKIHKIGLYEPEEDDIALFPIFCSVFMLFPFPFTEDLAPHFRMDDDLPEETKDAILRFYEGCVKRHLYVHGPEKRFLSKNPMFSGKTAALAKTFPDCQIVCNVRNPFDALPSLLSFVSYTWNRYDNDMKGMGFYDFILEMVHYWYLHPADTLPALGEDRHAFVPYDELTGALEPTLRGLYERFGLTIGPRYAKTLEVEFAKAAAYKSKHEYDLAEFGLTPERVRAQFGEVFERFDLDPSFDPS